jgi:hypothetical protein
MVEAFDWVCCGENSACVCRGVLRVWGIRIQDSRTDFGGFSRKMVDFATTRGWCKMEIVMETNTVDRTCKR